MKFSPLIIQDSRSSSVRYGVTHVIILDDSHRPLSSLKTEPDPSRNLHLRTGPDANPVPTILIVSPPSMLPSEGITLLIEAYIHDLVLVMLFHVCVCSTPLSLWLSSIALAPAIIACFLPQKSYGCHFGLSHNGKLQSVSSISLNPSLTLVVT